MKSHFRLFEKQILEDGVLDPSQIFEMKPVQEVEGETAEELAAKMESEALELPDDISLDDEETNALEKLAAKMTPLPEEERIKKRLCKQGEGSCPPIGAFVTIHYNGYNFDEISNQVVPYDSTVLRNKPQSFVYALHSARSSNLKL